MTREVLVKALAEQDSNLQLPDPKSGVLPIELPATGGTSVAQFRGSRNRLGGRFAPRRGDPVGWPVAMGSLIKKRRKRMRKKKHKKMLKATRWQRRAGK